MPRFKVSESILPLVLTLVIKLGCVICHMLIVRGKCQQGSEAKIAGVYLLVF